MLGVGAGAAYAMFAMNEKLKAEQQQRQQLQEQVTALGEKLE